MISERILRVSVLGISDYKQVLNLQKYLLERRLENKISNILLLTEHKPVFTLGKNASLNGVFPTEGRIEDLGIPVYRVERGGSITYHGPGQLVGYPIINLRDCRLSLSDYIWKLEEAMIQLLAEFRLKGYRKREVMPGVWVGLKKIGSIGIAVKNWVTYHGFALNVNPNIFFFRMIRPCGLDPGIIDSISGILDRNLDMGEVTKRMAVVFAGIFGMKIRKLVRNESKCAQTAVVES